MSASKRNDSKMCRTADLEEQCRERRLRRVESTKSARRLKQSIRYEERQ